MPLFIFPSYRFIFSSYFFIFLSYSSYILHNSFIFLHIFFIFLHNYFFIFLHTSFIPIFPPMNYGFWDLEKFRVFELGRISSSSICLYRDLEEFKNPSYLIYGHETCFSFLGEWESFFSKAVECLAGVLGFF